MSAVAEASPSIRARDNLSALGLHEMAAALPDYVRMVAAGERDFCSALEEMTLILSMRNYPSGTAVVILDRNGTGRKPHVQHRTTKDCNRDLHQIRS